MRNLRRSHWIQLKSETGDECLGNATLLTQRFSVDRVTSLGDLDACSIELIFQWDFCVHLFGSRPSFWSVGKHNKFFLGRLRELFGLSSANSKSICKDVSVTSIVCTTQLYLLTYIWRICSNFKTVMPLQYTHSLVTVSINALQYCILFLSNSREAVVCHINAALCRHLSPSDAARGMCVSRSFREILSDDYLWKQFGRIYGLDGPLGPCDEPKHSYRHASHCYHCWTHTLTAFSKFIRRHIDVRRVRAHNCLHKTSFTLQILSRHCWVFMPNSRLDRWICNQIQ